MAAPVPTPPPSPLADLLACLAKQETKCLLEWSLKNLGASAIIVAVVGIAAWKIWKDREHIGALVLTPVRPIRRIFPPRIPTVTDHNTFTLALAHLKDDTEDRRMENLIWESLNELHGVHVLRIPRTISFENSDEEGHKAAQKFLRRSGADVMLWGTVIHHERRSLPKLYWTQSAFHRKRAERYALTGDTLALPPVFWEHLSDLLSLLALTQAAEFPDSHPVVGRIEPFIQRARGLLRDEKGWKAEDRAAVRQILADSLQTLGKQSGENESLEKALHHYRLLLSEWTQERVPLQWATTQNSLGNTLRALGEREAGAARLEEAVQAYREALKAFTRERAPLQWAMTQNNLGNTLRALGEREAGTARLEEAVQAYREALKEFTRERVPLQRATTQNNLGAALRNLGEREAGTARLEEAVQAFREALKERTRERVPLQWAGTQNNLGNALRILGEREKEAAKVCEALSLHLAAWEVFAQGAPHYASAAAGGVGRDISSLKANFPQAVDACLDRHKETLARFEEWRKKQGLSSPPP